jgi:hypothetical protein
MEKERCHGGDKWFARIEQHLTYHNHCRSVMLEDARQQRLVVECCHRNNGMDTFLRQVGARMHEKLIMTKAKQFSVGMVKYYYGKQHHTHPPRVTPAMTSHTLSHITRCMSFPTMKPTIPMDGIRAVAPPV